jgi:N utilization substance protein B
MQAMYAFKHDSEVSLDEQSKFLTTSMSGMYNLYLLMLSLMVEVQNKALDHLTKSQKKHLATEQDKNPNKKFVANSILIGLKKNSLFNSTLSERKLDNWNLDNEYVELIFKALVNSHCYKKYLSTDHSSFKEDQEFLVEFYKTIIAENEKLYDYLEDKNITWVDDFPVVNTTLVKLIRKAKPTDSEHHFLPKLFKDIEDKQFAIDLLAKTYKNLEVYDTEISEKTQNWDKERITNIDLVLLQLAICELQEFPSIPVKVVINEYLEVAKEYSTPKSSVFINGILDKIVKEYTDKGTLNKTGRGLL